MKEIIFGDIHFGEKGNSSVFNQDCLDYIDFLCQYAISNDIKKCVFLGDYFHTRSALNVATLTSGLQGIRKLAETFDELIFILGNHDLYYRHSLSTHSLDFLKEFDNIRLIDEITVDGDCTYVPWLVNDMFTEFKNTSNRFIYGHFELPGFLLNAMSTMPDNGKIDVQGIKAEYLFSGHFHKRQNYVSESGCSINYIGSCFPHNFSDSNDNARGFCVHEHGEEPVFVNWEECPSYCSLPLSCLLESPEDYINDKTYAKILVDLNISQEEAIFIRETFMKVFQTREISYTRKAAEMQQYDESEMEDFESIDSIVINGLKNVDSNTLDTNVLIGLYNSL